MTRTLVVFSLVLLTIGCEKPQVATGTANAEGEVVANVTREGVNVTVSGFRIITPELEGSRGTERSRTPMLAMDVVLENNSVGPINYDLGWTTPTVSQSRSLMVYRGSDVELDVTEANYISEVDLGDFDYAGDPVDSPQTVAVGESVSDVVLLQVPDEGTESLIISCPPRLFGSENELPVYLVVPYAAADVETAETAGVGETVDASGYSMTLDSVSTEWARLTDANGEPGISDSPVLKIGYTITNTGDDSTAYRSAEQRGAFAFPVAALPDGTALTRVTTPSGVRVDGQIAEMKTLEAGESLSGFMLFARPPQGTESITFTWPGRRVGRAGNATFSAAYSWADPEKPAEWQDPQPEDEGSDESE